MTSGSERDGRVGQVLEAHPWLLSAGVGVGTFLAEYVAVALAFLVGPSSVDLDGPVETAVTYGHVLYNAHNVPTETVVQNATASASGNANALYGATGGSVPPIAYFLVPVVGLLAAGALVGWARAFSADLGPLKVSVDNAGELTLGYLAAGVAGAFVFARETTALGMSGTSSPNLPFTVVAFLLYPVAFGLVGSLAYLYWERRGS